MRVLGTPQAAAALLSTCGHQRCDKPSPVVLPPANQPRSTPGRLARILSVELATAKPIVHLPALPFPPSLHSHRRVLLMIACALALAATQARGVTPDFSGAWRLDDQHSDNAAALTTLLRVEARREQPAALPAPDHADAPSGSTNAGAGRHGGGMGGHGMSGGGMGGSGHGRHHADNPASQKPGTGQDSQGQTQFALPPLLHRDSVLLVQQQAKSVQVQLDNGERLDVRLDGHMRQSPDGDATVEGQAYTDALHITVRYAEGGELQQDWVRSADGQQLTIYCTWKLPSMQKPVHYKRSYLAVG